MLLPPTGWFAGDESAAVGAVQRVAFYNPGSARCKWLRAWMEGRSEPMAPSQSVVESDALDPDTVAALLQSASRHPAVRVLCMPANAGENIKTNPTAQSVVPLKRAVLERLNAEPANHAVRPGKDVLAN